MLANPVIVPFYAHPFVLGIALVSIFSEIYVALLLLRRFGLHDPRFATPLFLVNVFTWLPFVVALDRIVPPDLGDSLVPISLMEITIVILEALLIRLVTMGKLFSSRYQWSPISLRRTFLVSLVGNLTSIAASVGLTLLLIQPFG